jgi:hypothetical protein
MKILVHQKRLGRLLGSIELMLDHVGTTMTDQEFTPGFRISARDVAVLVAGMCGTLYLGMTTWYAGFIIGFPVVQFFLFCNVFRIDRKLELLWATVFVILVITTVKFGVPGWPLTIVLSLMMTKYLIFQEMKSPNYHGIGWQKINPRLHARWLENNQKCKQQSATVVDE